MFGLLVLEGGGEGVYLRMLDSVGLEFAPGIVGVWDGQGLYPMVFLEPCDRRGLGYEVKLCAGHEAAAVHVAVACGELIDAASFRGKICKGGHAAVSSYLAVGAGTRVPVFLLVRAFLVMFLEHVGVPGLVFLCSGT